MLPSPSEKKHGGMVASGHFLHDYRKSPFLMGKSTISMAIFNSHVSLPEGIQHELWMSGFVKRTLMFFHVCVCPTKKMFLHPVHMNLPI